MIGTTVIRSSDVLCAENMECPLRDYDLKGSGGNPKISLAVNIRCLKKGGPVVAKTNLTDPKTMSEELPKPEAAVTTLAQKEVLTRKVIQ